MFIHANDTDHRFAGMVEMTGRIVRVRQKAIEFECGLGKAWLPTSKIKTEPNRDGTVTVALPKWLARDRGYV